MAQYTIFFKCCFFRISDGETFFFTSFDSSNTVSSKLPFIALIVFPLTSFAFTTFVPLNIIFTNSSYVRLYSLIALFVIQSLELITLNPTTSPFFSFTSLDKINKLGFASTGFKSFVNFGNLSVAFSVHRTCPSIYSAFTKSVC